MRPGAPSSPSSSSLLRPLSLSPSGHTTASISPPTPFFLPPPSHSRSRRRTSDGEAAACASSSFLRGAVFTNGEPSPAVPKLFCSFATCPFQVILCLLKILVLVDVFVSLIHAPSPHPSVRSSLFFCRTTMRDASPLQGSPKGGEKERKEGDPIQSGPKIES